MGKSSRYGLLTTIRYGGEEFDGYLYLGEEGIYVFRKRLFRKPYLHLYLPYVRIVKVDVKRQLLSYRLDILFSSGSRVDKLSILGGRDLKNLRERINELRIWARLD